MKDAASGFGTFAGVWRPTLLTNLGALLFLREGWLVGNSGLTGAFAVILGAYLITGTTALAVSSLASNVRVQAGGAFAMIAQALGLEAGGAIGLPLFFAQCASAALYLFAFAEAWQYLFPTHSTAVLVLVAFAGVGVLSWTSARVAFRAQAVLLVVVGAAILSAWLGVFSSAPELVMPDVVPARVDLRRAFAIFFPAATGIMVGVGMSGVLARPRVSIPKGILGAWSTSLVILLVTAFWYAHVASPEELLAEKTIMIRRALFGPVVLVGLFSTTLMAACSSLLAASRLLAAMGAQRVVPGGPRLEVKVPEDEPRSALLVSLAVTLACLLSGSLDAVAPVVTSFFILTYLAINLVVLLEQRLGMVSFRPTMSLAPWVPLVGVAASTVGLFVATPVSGVVGLILVVTLYLWLQGRKIHTPWETVRSGIHVRVAAWAARSAAGAERTERAWTPEVLLPVAHGEETDDVLRLAGRLVKGVGGIRLVGLRTAPGLEMALDDMAARLRSTHVYATTTVVECEDVADGTCLVIDSLRGLLMAPNLVLMDGASRTERDLQVVLDHCHARRLGMGVLLSHPDGALGRGRQITVWLSERSPDWTLQIHNANLDLPALAAYLLVRNGGGQLRLATVVRDVEERANAHAFLRRIVDMGRLPQDTECLVSEGSFLQAMEDCPYADIHVLGLATTVDLPRLEAVRDAAAGACLYLLDSGQESLLA